MATPEFFIASVIVSFLAGVVALAMPCCFSVLLPSYFASVFKKKTAILRMTVVFALGIAAIMLPIALGVSEVSAYIGINHSLLFVVGGFFMLFLGAASLLGIQLIPMFSPDVNLQGRSVPSVFALGVFSGVASSCCAPVLAGILVLTALTSSLAGASVVGLAYVLGMVSPLLVAGFMMDKTNAVQTFLRGRMVSTPMGAMHSSKLLAGVLFISMGAVTVVLGVLDKMLPTPGADIFNIYEAVIQNVVEQAISSLAFQAAAVGALAIAVGAYALRRLRGSKRGATGAAEDEGKTEVHI